MSGKQFKVALDALTVLLALGGALTVIRAGHWIVGAVFGLGIAVLIWIGYRLLFAPIKTIFISYASEDRLWAKELARILEDGDTKVFFDADSIRTGDDWEKRIAAALASCDSMRLVWFRNAASSDWVRREYIAALRWRMSRLRIERLDNERLPPKLAHIQAENSLWRGRGGDRYLNEAGRVLDDPPRPIQLLRPEFAVVPFHSNEPTLDELESWCLDKEPFSARLYTGPADVGKTRLVVEGCRRLDDRRWQTGFLDRDFLRARDHPAVVSEVRPRVRSKAQASPGSAGRALRCFGRDRTYGRPAPRDLRGRTDQLTRFSDETSVEQLTPLAP